ncbi:hypothetical protein JCM8115_006829 [Rhodotorula mucilaginosa]|uniref:Serine hydrolase domain-containing protein n=1 Tax=Rhodotorula mucilaginosa TaxID=5537 RepID=A0A9P7B7E6_RHOMI|nr:hypothetical protein C6P46_003353 [Rhodotorula mucilaginosa]TKA54117.1 hypothetical protein B0A53_03494 [Rhodotorula sp. CCFEE 5036]
MSTPIRLLALPGHGQSAAVLDGKLAKHREIWGDRVEVVAMDQPYSLLMPSICRGEAGVCLDASDKMLQPAFTWWDWSSHWKFQPGEFEGAALHLRRFMERHGPFDAVLGFSQGAAMAVLLLALLEYPELHPIWTAGPSPAGVEWPPAPMKCAILCSAFGPLDPKFQRWFQEQRPLVPTLHLIGKNDIVADPQHSLDTAARFVNPNIVWHDGGHHIPRKPYYANLMLDFLVDSCDRHEWSEDELQDGWITPTESIASSMGEGNPHYPVSPLRLAPFHASL